MAVRLLLLAFALLQFSCASKPAWQEDGWASYVADFYTGRRTSSGELYHPQAYTAAHYSLPFGTVVTVKNLHSGRTVNVTVNDRFPYYPGRVINLSSVAAQHIGIPYMSMAQVRVTANSVPQGGGYAARQPSYAPAYQQHTAPPVYAQQPVYQQQVPAPVYPMPQQAATAPIYPTQSAPQTAAAPRPAPAQTPAPAAAPAQRSWWRNPFSSAGPPNAQQYQGGNAPPAGLQTF